MPDAIVSELFSSHQWPSPATIWPSALESYFADGVKRLVRSGDNVTDGPKCRELLIPLLEPDVPLRPMARLLIAVGLAAKLPELAGLATDALIAAIDDGRIDAARLGESLRTVWRWEVRQVDPGDQSRGEYRRVALSASPGPTAGRRHSATSFGLPRFTPMSSHVHWTKFWRTERLAAAPRRAWSRFWS